ISDAQRDYLCHLKREWETRYNHFVEQVAEAVSQINDGEALRERVLRLRRSPTEPPRTEQAV
ncbi:MAG: hypothetical protein SNJ72_11040, partial [Fimbriimonadales bacterium]